MKALSSHARPALVMPADAVRGVMLSNPKDCRIDELEVQVVQLEACAVGAAAS